MDNETLKGYHFTPRAFLLSNSRILDCIGWSILKKEREYKKMEEDNISIKWIHFALYYTLFFFL